jgi:hypothetical protein
MARTASTVYAFYNGTILSVYEFSQPTQPGYTPDQFFHIWNDVLESNSGVQNDTTFDYLTSFWAEVVVETQIGPIFKPFMMSKVMDSIKALICIPVAIFNNQNAAYFGPIPAINQNLQAGFGSKTYRVLYLISILTIACYLITIFLCIFSRNQYFVGMVHFTFVLLSFHPGSE